MAFDLHIKNIGKLTDAKLRIGQFTVLAGPNNTGKSFVSKILYSLFDAMNANHLELYVHRQTNPAKEWLQDMQKLGVVARKFFSGEFFPGEVVTGEEKKESLASVNSALALIELLLARIDELEEQAKKLSRLGSNKPSRTTLELADDISENFNKLSDDRIVKMLRGIHKTVFDTANEKKHEAVSLLVPFVMDIAHELQNAFSLEEPKKFSEAFRKIAVDLQQDRFIFSSIKYRAARNLVQNFQTSKLTRLQHDEKRTAEIFLEEIGKFSFANEAVDCDAITELGLRKLQRYSKVLYLESPAHWMLKGPLESIRLSPRYQYAHREPLTGVPEYFYDLMSALRIEYAGDMDFPELYAELTGKNVLGGKLVISDTGEILFRENGRNIPLALTATGVINLGVLALLIERKILNKDSFVFIDEPEAHLHPEWQVVMAETLFKLAEDDGAHIVIATHSIDILKWLEVHAKKDQKYKDMIELNQFSPHGVEGGSRDFDEKMASILQELTGPFAKNFIDGV